MEGYHGPLIYNAIVFGERSSVRYGIIWALLYPLKYEYIIPSV